MALPEGLRCGTCGGEIAPDDAFCQTCGIGLAREAAAPAADPVRLDIVAAGRSPAMTTAALPARDDTRSESTRFLCAGAYLDESFARAVVGELFGETARAVPPSHGYDLRLVAAHCLSARSVRRLRDALLAVLGLAMLLFGSAGTVWSGIFWAGVGWLVGALREGPGGLYRAIGRVTWRDVWFTALVASLATGLAFVWAIVLAVAFVFLLAASATTPGSSSTGTSFNAGAFLANLTVLLGVAELIAIVGFLLAVFGWVALYVIVLVELVVAQLTAVRRFKRATFRADPEAGVSPGRRMRDRLAGIDSGQSNNVTIYSGFDPFIGAGQVVPGWSFAIPLVGAKGREAQSFSVTELVAHVQRRIASIAGSEGAPPDGALPGLSVSDRVFVNGLAVEGDERFVPVRGAAPRTRLAAGEIEAVAALPRGAVRHYCSMHVQSWAGEIVTSTFFHCSTDGDKLYFEWVKRVLGPVRHEYHEVDVLPASMTPGWFLRLAAEAAVRTVPMVIGAPGRVLSDLLLNLRVGRRRTDSVIDYGARLSARELAAETDDVFLRVSELGCHNYFQDLDVDKHLKVVERHALAAMVDFLIAHGIDASEFTTRAGTILDNSVTVIGSGNVLGAVATGAGATASQGGNITVEVRR